MTPGGATDPSAAVETDCERTRRVLGDPEASELDRKRARNHDATCPTCARDRSQDRLLAALRGPLPGAGGSEADALLAGVARHRPHVGLPVRAVLGAAAAVQFVLSFPWLFGGNPLGSILGHPSSEHLTRDGALGVIVAVAGAVTAWRTRYAFSMLSLCASVIVLQLLTAIVDRSDDHVGAEFEAVHMLALAIVGMVVVIALRRERPKGPLPPHRPVTR